MALPVFIISCDKAKKYWHKTFILIQKILKINIKLKTEVFFLGLLDKGLENYFKYWPQQEFCMHRERHINSHNGRMDAKGDGPGGDVKIDCLN